jgi:zinc protease
MTIMPRSPRCLPAAIVLLAASTIGCSLVTLNPEEPTPKAGNSTWQSRVDSKPIDSSTGDELATADTSKSDSGETVGRSTASAAKKPGKVGPHRDFSTDGDTTQYTMSNGMRVVLREQHFAPVVAQQVWVNIGGADEIGPEAGIAHVHEHMLFKGTKRRGVGEIASSVEGAGGRINAWTSWDQTVYHVVVASRFSAEGVDILSDAVRNSSFDPTELDKELGVVLEEFKRSRDSASSRLFQGLFGQAFSHHPYKRPVIGTEESIKGLTREMILDFYARYYAPSNMTFVAVGDFDTKEMMAELDKRFGDFENRTLEKPLRPSEPAQSEIRFATDSMDINEGNLALGFHIPDATHPDTVILDVLAHVLGEGETSRLYRRMVINEPLATSAGAFAYTPRDPGMMIVTATFEPDKEEEAAKAALEELAAVRDLPVTMAELERARANLRSEFVYRRQTVQGQAGELGQFVVIYDDLNYDDTYVRALDRITPADLQRVARQYLTPLNLTGIAVLPEEQPSELSLEKLTSLARVISSDAPAVVAGVGPATLAPAQYQSTTETNSAPKLFTMANGAKIILQENHSVPLFSVRIAMLGGTLTETRANNGISSFATEMLTRGTLKHDREALAETIENLAGNISGFSGRNSVGVSATFLSEHFEEGLGLTLEVLTQPAFDPTEVEKARHELLLAIDHREDNTASRTFDLAFATLYPKHPYGMTILGEKDSVASMSADDLRRHYRDALDPRSMVISVVGDIDIETTAQMLKAQIGGLINDDAPFKMPTPATLPTSIQIARKETNRRQTHLVTAFPGLRVSDEDRHAMTVLETILSGQGGRLFYELRDQQALAYSVTAFSSEGLDRGLIGAYIATDPANETTAMEGLLTELAKVRESPVSDEELQRAKRYLIGNYEIALQTNGATAENMGFNELYGLGYLEGRRYASQINAITVEDVMHVAQRYLDENIRVEAVIGPALFSAETGEQNSDASSGEAGTVLPPAPKAQ